ncbi:UPF0496 protein [Nymphaea thermarum]|nr:UPF0496 protein [Nymphaea thermarum]
MGNEWSNEWSGTVKDEHHLLELCKLSLSGNSAGRAVTFEFINRAMSLVTSVNKQTMKLPRCVPWRDIRKDELLGCLKEDFLDLSLEADSFLRTLLSIIKGLKEELDQLLHALLDWTPSRRGQGQILEKLRRFRSVEKFSDQFLQSLEGLVKQHQGMVEKIRRHEALLDRKIKAVEWLKTVIFTIFAGFFAAAVISSVVAVAMHTGPLLASFFAAATSVASWGPLASWVEEMWGKRLEKLHFEKSLCAMQQDAEADKERVLHELEPICSLVNELKQRLEDVRSTEVELQLTKASLLKEVCMLIDCVNDSIKKVEECEKEVECRRGKFLKRIAGGSNCGQSSKNKTSTLLFG